MQLLVSDYDVTSMQLRPILGEPLVSFVVSPIDL